MATAYETAVKNLHAFGDTSSIQADASTYNIGYTDPYELASLIENTDLEKIDATLQAVTGLTSTGGISILDISWVAGDANATSYEVMVVTGGTPTYYYPTVSPLNLTTVAAGDYDVTVSPIAGTVKGPATTAATTTVS